MLSAIVAKAFTASISVTILAQGVTVMPTETYINKNQFPDEETCRADINKTLPTFVEGARRFVASRGLVGADVQIAAQCKSTETGV